METQAKIWSKSRGFCESILPQSRKNGRKRKPDLGLCRVQVTCPRSFKNRWPMQEAATDVYEISLVSPSCQWTHSWLRNFNKKGLRQVLFCIVRPHLSLTAKQMLLTPAFLKILWTFCSSRPAMFSPLICRIWSPKRRPPMAAGLPLVTKATKTPLSIDLTRRPTLPSLSLHKIT